MAIEISVAYVEGGRDNLGNPRVSSEKFHVVHKVVEACEQVRKAESCADVGKRDLLELKRWMWFKNRVK